MSEEMRARRFLISGRVQGVGFRWFTKNAAEQVGIVGTVRNLFDGRVEAVGVGSEAELAEFKRIVSKGPSFSHVSEIKEEELQDIPRYSRFDIIH